MSDSGPAPRQRLVAIDWLRGIVMVLMVLDHARDFFGDFRVDPLALGRTTPALFATRWVTHFCAPTFVLLAGVGAFLYGARRSRAQLARFLLTRGLWLVVLEFTVVQLGWTTRIGFPFWFLQVIAAIGFAMVLLAPLVFLPRGAVLALGLLVVCGHNAFDDVAVRDVVAEWGRAAGGAWTLLKEGSIDNGALLRLSLRQQVLVAYPLLPWFGVLALGYALGPVFRMEPAARRRVLLRLGVGALTLFAALRATGVYGDPQPWAEQGTALHSVLSFVHCDKYPPSLQYLLMTLGPALLALALLDREPGRLGRRMVVFGRVPLFFYVLHLYLVNGGSQLFHWAVYGEAFSAFGDGMPLLFTGRALPPWYGHPLWVVYAAWLAVLLLMYPACAWYERVKRTHPSPWLSYL
ncbi:MAG: DUF1624 domain-containing protein [Planctomycetota bacterium]